jgi:hypothetical protein
MQNNNLKNRKIVNLLNKEKWVTKGGAIKFGFVNPYRKRIRKKMQNRQR